MVAPSVLPRWHQDDRGPKNRSRGHHELAPASAYAAAYRAADAVSWHGRRHWLERVIPAVINEYAAQMRQFGVSPEAVTVWATVKSGYVARPSTGQQLIVRPSTLASVMDMTKRQVQRLNAFARAIGLEIVAQTGRMLTQEESTAARKRGSTQRGLSTESALCIPRGLAAFVDYVTPTRGKGQLLGKCHGDLHSPQDQTQSDATRPKPKVRVRGDVDAASTLAAGIVRKLPWLIGEQRKRLIPSLMRFVSSPMKWSASDVVTALIDRSTRLKRPMPSIDTAHKIDRPAAYLASMLKDLHEEADHPRLYDDEVLERPDVAPRSPVLHTKCGGCRRGWLLDEPTGALVPCEGHGCGPERFEWLGDPYHSTGAIRTASQWTDPEALAASWDHVDPPF